MPTIRTRKNADGTIKFNAMARIRIGGKQITRTATFLTREEAEEWGEKTENELKSDKVKAIYNIDTNPADLSNHTPNLKVLHPVPETANKIKVEEALKRSSESIKNVTRCLGDEFVNFIGVSRLIDYFHQRHNEGATLAEIQDEISLLQQLVCLGDCAKDRYKIVMHAYNALTFDGYKFK